MAYDLKLAERLRSELSGIPTIEKKMFGGIGFLLNGNMVCGVNKEDLVIRVDPAKHEMLLKQSHTRPFDITGRPMKGWLIVEAEGVKSKKQLGAWIKEGLEFASTLPPK
jgi:TfoX/Sxy family transcriptional regulator of competence genes